MVVVMAMKMFRLLLLHPPSTEDAVCATVFGSDPYPPIVCTSHHLLVALRLRQLLLLSCLARSEWVLAAAAAAAAAPGCPQLLVLSNDAFSLAEHENAQVP